MNNFSEQFYVNFSEHENIHSCQTVYRNPCFCALSRATPCPIPGIRCPFRPGSYRSPLGADINALGRKYLCPRTQIFMSADANIYAPGRRYSRPWAQISSPLDEHILALGRAYPRPWASISSPRGERKHSALAKEKIAACPSDILPQEDVGGGHIWRVFCHSHAPKQQARETFLPVSVRERACTCNK